MAEPAFTGPVAAGSPRAWVKNRKLMATGAVVLAAAAALALYHKHQLTKAAAKTPSSSTTTTAATGTSTYDTSVMDAYNQLEQQITALQNNQTTTTTTPPPVTTSPPVVTPPPPPPPSPPPASTPPPGGVVGGPAPPATSPTATWVYTVQDKDTLSSIAARNPTKVDLATLLQMNPTYTTNPKYQGGNKIWAGDHVVLPGSGPLK